VSLQGHAAAVYVSAFSPDGRHLASCSLDKSVRVWRAAGGDALATLLGHTRGVADVVWSADSAQLVSGGFDGVVRRWHVEARDAISHVRLCHSVQACRLRLW
jgi:COMPASS component SWD3